MEDKSVAKNQAKNAKANQALKKHVNRGGNAPRNSGISTNSYGNPPQKMFKPGQYWGPLK